MDSSPALPALISPSDAIATLEGLAAIPEEEIWLASQKSARTRRAYKQDVAHFTRTLGITSPEQLRQVDHRAVIAWERVMREQVRRLRFSGQWDKLRADRSKEA